MANDKRYKTVRLLIIDGHIKNLTAIFDVIPKTVIAKDLNIGITRFNKMIGEVERFGVGKLFRLAELINVDELTLLSLICRQYREDKAKKRKISSKGKRGQGK